MKKILLTIAIRNVTNKVILYSALLAFSQTIIAEEQKWYLLDSNTAECTADKMANPYRAKQAGMDVKDNDNGFFTITVEGNSLWVFDSKKTCEKAAKVLKSKKHK